MRRRSNKFQDLNIPGETLSGAQWEALATKSMSQTNCKESTGYTGDESQ